jgi:hypothetical protein
MKNLYLPLLLVSALSAPGAVLTDVAFSIQGSDLTWFDAGDPTVQGSVSLTGLPGGFTANSLALDTANNRLLFTSGGAFQNQPIFSVDLSAMILEPGTAVAGIATSVGNFSFSSPQMLLGGGFYNGSYYALRNESDTLIRIDFDALGQALPQVTINLPGDREMNLGDIAFDQSGNLLISGYNAAGTTAADDRFWRYETNDGGLTFSELTAPINPPGDRFNGIGYLVDGQTLFGYNAITGNYGEIDPDTGNFTFIYSGGPFDNPGDLSSAGPVLVIPEPSTSLLIFGGLGLALTARRRHS